MGLERSYTDIVAHNITGAVVWFNKEKGFGFVVSDLGARAFLHMNDIFTNPEDYPEQGDRLIYDLRNPEKGLQAVNAHYIERNLERMRESLKEVAAAICNKEEYSAAAFETVSAATLKEVNSQYRAGIDELCDSYVKFRSALDNMVDLNCGIEQLQNMLDVHEPESAHRVRLPKNDRVLFIRSGLDRGGVTVNMNAFIEERAKRNES